jgi:Uma2 family endonuclease
MWMWSLTRFELMVILNQNFRMTTNIIEQLMERPDLPIILKELQQRLTREEQQRKAWLEDSRTDTFKMEFINGQVIVHAPAQRVEALVSGNVASLLRTSVLLRQAGEIHQEKAMIRLTRNDYEPDICYFDTAQVAEFNEETSLFPAPRLVVEVLSPKTEARDRGIKFQDYAYHAIPEYWIVDPRQQTLEQYLLTEGATTYQLYKKSDNGDVDVQVLPGLKLPIPAFFDERKAQDEVERLLY